MEFEVVVGKRGRITIPANLRQKFGIQGGARLKVVKTKEGILFKIKPEDDASEKALKKLDNPPDPGAVKGNSSSEEIHQG
jgi:AbrB family looped-hinge helix DNA binding protein